MTHSIQARLIDVPIKTTYEEAWKELNWDPLLEFRVTKCFKEIFSECPWMRLAAQIGDTHVYQVHASEFRQRLRGEVLQSATGAASKPTNSDLCHHGTTTTEVD